MEHKKIFVFIRCTRIDHTQICVCAFSAFFKKLFIKIYISLEKCKKICGDINYTYYMYEFVYNVLYEVYIYIYILNIIYDI